MAGTAAKIVGALWGKESVENPTFVGIVCTTLTQACLTRRYLILAWVRFWVRTKPTKHSLSWLYTNSWVKLRLKTLKTELASYMDSGAYSQAGFARAIADLDLNATNINLVGLTDTGLQYAEYGA